MLLPLSFVLLLALVNLANADPPPPPPSLLPPLICVPGLTGSYLQIKFGANPPTGCPKRTPWLPFLPYAAIVDLSPECFLKVASLVYDATHGNYTPPPDTEIRPTDWGGIRGFVNLNVSALIKEDGYVVNKTLFGAPYDWRFAPDGGLDPFYNDFVKLVEEVVNNTNERVSIYAASNGPMVMLSFFNWVNATKGLSWIRRNLFGFFPDSGVWAGAVEVMNRIARADVLNPWGKLFPPETELLLRNISSSWPSEYWNFPRLGPGPDTYNQSDILITTPDRNYSALDTADFLYDVFGNDSGIYEHPADIWNRVKYLTSQPFNYPPLNTYIYWGLQPDSTKIKFIYNQSFPGSYHQLPAEPTSLSSYGDWLVPQQSSERAIDSWATIMPKAGYFVSSTYFDMGHANCLILKQCRDQFMSDVKHNYAYQRCNIVPTLDEVSSSSSTSPLGPVADYVTTTMPSGLSLPQALVLPPLCDLVFDGKSSSQVEWCQTWNKYQEILEMCEFDMTCVYDWIELDTLPDYFANTPCILRNISTCFYDCVYNSNLSLCSNIGPRCNVFNSSDTCNNSSGCLWETQVGDDGGCLIDCTKIVDPYLCNRQSTCLYNYQTHSCNRRTCVELQSPSLCEWFNCTLTVIGRPAMEGILQAPSLFAAQNDGMNRTLTSPTVCTPPGTLVACEVYSRHHCPSARCTFETYLHKCVSTNPPPPCYEYPADSTNPGESPHCPAPRCQIVSNSAGKNFCWPATGATSNRVNGNWSIYCNEMDTELSCSACFIKPCSSFHQEQFCTRLPWCAWNTNTSSCYQPQPTTTTLSTTTTAPTPTPPTPPPSPTSTSTTGGTPSTTSSTTSKMLISSSSSTTNTIDFTLCSQYTNSTECDPVNCIWNENNTTCTPRSCSTYTTAGQCLLPMCFWSVTHDLCVSIDDVVCPCQWDAAPNNKCLSKDAPCQEYAVNSCPAPRCRFDGGSHLCWASNESIPCGYFIDQSSCINQYCCWDDYLLQCLDTKPPCGTYTLSTTCNAVINCSWNYDAMAGLGYCMRVEDFVPSNTTYSTILETRCNILLDPAQCEQSEDCVYDDINQICRATTGCLRYPIDKCAPPCFVYNASDSPSLCVNSIMNLPCNFYNSDPNSCNDRPNCQSVVFSDTATQNGY